MPSVFKNILLIVLGPLITLILYIGGEGGKISQDNLAMLMRNIMLCATVTIIVSIIVHYLIKNFKKGMIISVILSEIIFVPLIIIFLLISNVTNRPKTEMWMPVIMIFLIINTLPMALLISYGTGKIMGGKKENNNKVAPDKIKR